MNKEITIIENLGHYTPSNANWSYRFHIIIDHTGSRMYHDTFGGVDRLRDRLTAEGYVIRRLSGGKGSISRYMASNVRDTLDIEGYSGSNY